MNKFFALTVALVAFVATAAAGSWKLQYDPNGKIVMKITRTPAGNDILRISALAGTADRHPGDCRIKIDGVVISMLPGAPYYYDVFLVVGATLPAWRDPKNPNFQKDAKDIVLDERFFAMPHLIEAYFVTEDDRGRSDKNKSDAPGQIFELRPIQPSSEVSLTQDQLNAGHGQAYEQGVADARSSWEKERDELIAQLNALSNQQAEERREEIAPTPRVRKINPTLPESYRSIVDRLKGATFVAYKLVGDQKVSVGEFRVVSIDPKTLRTVMEGKADPAIPDNDLRLMLKEGK